MDAYRWMSPDVCGWSSYGLCEERPSSGLRPPSPRCAGRRGASGFLSSAKSQELLILWERRESRSNVPANKKAEAQASAFSFIEWWSGRGSNPRPPRCERGALPAELPPHSTSGKYTEADQRPPVVASSGASRVSSWARRQPERAPGQSSPSCRASIQRREASTPSGRPSSALRSATACCSFL
jgi:hypothetical protein